MFKFLKKKLKGFENKLEAELEAELAKEKPKEIEEKEIKKPELTVKPIKERKQQTTKKEEEIKQIEPEKKSITKETLETKKEKPTYKKEEKIIKKKEDKERRKRVEADRKKREDELDKQIERSIEAELTHTLKTRRSIEQVVQLDKKASIIMSDDKLDELLWDLEVGLLESDVAYNVIESIKKDIKEEIKHISVERGKIGETVEKVLKNAISNVLMSNELDFIEFIKKHEKPIVIMFIGVNGSGKTLSIAKIATMLKKNGYSCVMAAGDTFRAGAIEQLSIHAEKIGVKIIKHGPGADPAAVAYDAIDHAKAKRKDVVLLDTAGRVQTNINLMDEMAKIKRVSKPDLILFVGDALSGNDAVEQAKRFNEVCGIDGVILTKVDTDAKGGSALSVAYTIGKPLLFIGVGQKYEDHIPFDPDWMIKNIFGQEE
jgi:fused signal recognition particle receptor